LAEFLSDDFGGGIGIQEAMPDNLADHFAGASIVGLGARDFVLQGSGSLLLEALSELEIALFAVAKLSGGLDGAHAFAFPLEKHRQFVSDMIVFRDGQRTLFADEDVFLPIELNHVPASCM